MAFNPNELIIERVRGVEEYVDGDFRARYTQIEDPTLNLTSDNTDIVDALNSPIYTLYTNQQGTFGFTNSLFSMDLAADQFGAVKNVASADDKIQVPASEILKITDSHTVTLTHTPVDGSVNKIYVVNSDKTFGESYVLDADGGDGKFTLSGNVITLPETVTGRVFVDYTYDSENAASITKTSDSIPDIVSLKIYVIMRDVCNPNTKYAGVVFCPRAQVDPTSIEIGFNADSKHAASWLLRKSYCEDDSPLVEVIVSKD